MSVPQFIDLDNCDTRIGMPGFLYLFEAPGEEPKWGLRHGPMMGRENAKLYGWCGERENVCTTAHGVARATEPTSNGRAQLQLMTTPDQLQTALIVLCHPELMPG